MPLRKGSSKETISSNIAEIMDSYSIKGTIGTAKPRSKAKALKQAVAISYSKARESKRSKKGY